ncbi:MAG: polyprenyl synthetase family protein [Actinomycetota bacterium]|nr:polyprenyl synthetase family protein [Actinomycetota bacterium]MEC9394931.1 polyprenyl synthetase family protein [Actinomycetota bacterium]MED6327410.1 polyprenyl synthetase family protein [Actinomycetota bacterium]MEE2958877.1 polyprenyl synthetase family protein [Actinomycetota bacterium]
MNTATPAVLERARLLVEPSLSAAVDRLADELRLLARYHFGWVEADGSPSDAGAGKGLRPALAVLSAEAVGAEASVAVPGAVAVQLVHDFSLIHDDIIDGDDERRHRPTVWSTFGVDDAIIVGDALHNLAFQVLLENPSPERVSATVRLVRATTSMIAGQAADMAFDDLSEVDLAACVAMEADKTGALLGYSASVGAVLAGGTAQQIDALKAYGGELGLAFQAVDDVLGIWGDPAVTGKAAGNDLRERKKSMPVALVLSAGGTASDELSDLYAVEGDLSEDQVARAAELIADAGGRDGTVAEARTHLDAALAAIGGVGFEPTAVDELAAVARFVADRDF